jgi:hypothetical protein
MHAYSLVFVIVGGLLGVGLITYGRRSEKGRHLAPTIVCGLVVILAVLLTIDFIATPGDRWVSGIGLVGAVLAVGGFGYEWFRRSKAHSRQ